MCSYDNLETNYTRMERFWKALNPDLLNQYAVTDSKNPDVPAIFDVPTIGATVLTMSNLAR